MPTMTREAPRMVRKRVIAKTQALKVTPEAMQWARIAAGYTSESIAEYASRVLAERGKQDAERLHAERVGVSKPTKK